MRRRRTQVVAPTVGETEPLDEHDQEEAVASLKHEGMQQIETTNRIFTFVCILAMSMTFVAVLQEARCGNGFTRPTHLESIGWQGRMV